MTATLLFNWRLDFAIGNTADDIVEQLQFTTQRNEQETRAIERTRLTTETKLSVKPESFRGWLIRDPTLTASADGANTMGYYLDPQASGFSYPGTEDNWTRHDFIVTTHQACQQLAANNRLANPSCANHLSAFVNGEPLQHNDLVVWFNLARQFLPMAEDFPQIQPREVSFKLIPFDWSAATPFAPPE
ncbi:MAG: hypothetical protein AAF404_15000 [Pseudomonadota bacterium]